MRKCEEQGLISQWTCESVDHSWSVSMGSVAVRVSLCGCVWDQSGVV